jgi:hypothetical protein
MLSIGLCDQIDKVPNAVSYSNLCMTKVGYYYHSVDVFSLSPKVIKFSGLHCI